MRYRDAKLLNAERIGESEFWPNAEHDRKWYRRAPGPTGKFVETEIKFRRKEHEFDGHRGNFVPLILVKQREPHFGENAGSFYSAALENEGPGFRKGFRLGILPQELKSEIGFDRGAEFAAIAVIKYPTPPFSFWCLRRYLTMLLCFPPSGIPRRRVSMTYSHVMVTFDSSSAHQ